MYDLIRDIIAHVYTSGDSSQQYIYYICGSLIIVLSAVTIDLLYRVFSHFWRGGNK